ncbi:MAG TPA: hypothetical protein VI278_03115 [Nitrososphaeraceae archaeon]
MLLLLLTVDGQQQGSSKDDDNVKKITVAIRNASAESLDNFMRY